MSLRYSFRHLFYGGKIQKERLYKVLEDLDASNGGDELDISSLKTTVGDSTKGLVKDVADHTTAIGKASGDGAGGILKDIADLKSVVGDASTENTLVKDVASIETAIGDESTEGTILARIKALEDAE